MERDIYIVLAKDWNKFIWSNDVISYEYRDNSDWGWPDRYIVEQKIKNSKGHEQLENP